MGRELIQNRGHIEHLAHPKAMRRRSFHPAVVENLVVPYLMMQGAGRRTAHHGVDNDQPMTIGDSIKQVEVGLRRCDEPDLIPKLLPMVIPPTLEVVYNVGANAVVCRPLVAYAEDQDLQWPQRSTIFNFKKCVAQLMQGS